MALSATLFKVTLKIADMDRNYYRDHTLTVARHPSETDERMMVRVLAFALNADDALAFGKGLSNDEEPALWRKDLTGAVELAIEVGQPDEKSIRKACGRARRVTVYNYGGRVADMWWRQNSGALARQDNLTVVNVPATTGAALAKMAQRTMQLHCTIQDGQMWLADDERTVAIELITLQSPTAAQ